MTDEQLSQRFDALAVLMESIKDSLEREIRGVGDRVDRMSTRLDKIAAGAHYVTRLVEWSEKQDAHAADVLAKVQQLEARVSQLEKKQ